MALHNPTSPSHSFPAVFFSHLFLIPFPHLPSSRDAYLPITLEDSSCVSVSNKLSEVKENYPPICTFLAIGQFSIVENITL